METIFLVLFILFISTLIRSAFGFGDALVAMPLLSVVVGLDIATPLVAFVASLIAITFSTINFKQFEFKVMLKLLLPSMLTIPIGIWLAQTVDEKIIKGLLSILVVLYAIYNLVKPNLLMLKDDRLIFLFGGIAGILGGAYNINGLAIAIYGTLRNWSPKKFQITLQGYFLPMSIVLSTNHLLFSKKLDEEVFPIFIYAIPVVFIAIAVGNIMNKRLALETFKKYIYVLLFIIGLGLLLKTV